MANTLEIKPEEERLRLKACMENTMPYLKEAVGVYFTQTAHLPEKVEGWRIEAAYNNLKFFYEQLTSFLESENAENGSTRSGVDCSYRAAS